MPKGLQGFQPGHGAFPGNRGNRGMRGKWKRPDNRTNGSGFQPGHPPYYTGGSVPGHAPTNRNPDSSRLGDPNDPTSERFKYRYDQPLGIENRKRYPGGHRAKDKERQCLEAIQNGSEPEKLKKRFPPGMVQRLVALHDVAEDPEHRDFMRAQMMVSDILKRLARDTTDGANGDGQDSTGVAAIELVPGTATPPPLFEKEETPPAGVLSAGGA